MNHVDPKRIMPVAMLAVVLLLTACEQSGAPDLEESVLRVHDVSGLQVEELDEKLNELLSREDLPLRGKVELLDDNRLAVNASRYLQDEIVAMIDQLRDYDSSSAIERPFRVQYWFLRMAKGEGGGDVPASVNEDLAPLLERFEGYSLSVEDYVETYHTGTSSVGSVSSGQGARIAVRSAESTKVGMKLRARVYSPGQAASISYEVGHMLVPGKALVLGQVHDGGDAAQASYQVLVARAEWTDSTD